MLSFFISFFMLLVGQHSLETTYGNSQVADGYTISGKVLKPSDPKGWIILLHLTPTGEKKIDSVQLNNKNTFFFKGSVNKKDFYAISFFKKQYVLFILENNNKTLEIEADGDSPKSYSNIKGGAADNEYLKQTDIFSMEMQRESTRLSEAFNSALEDNNKEKQENIKEQFYKFQERSTRQIKNLIRPMGTSPAVFYALRLMDKEIQEEEFLFLDSLAQKFKKLPEKSEYARLFIETLEQKQSLAIGRPAPEIELETPSGKRIKLSSLRGKYVLVDFWASWCGPCRQENPNVVRMYNEYKNKNFEIFGVSLDEDKDKWTKAIDKDKLSWIHVSDLKSWDSSVVPLYQLQAIPATVLLDPQGIIIAKNLRGENLEAKLAEILK